MCYAKLAKTIFREPAVAAAAAAAAAALAAAAAAAAALVYNKTIFATPVERIAQTRVR